MSSGLELNFVEWEPGQWYWIRQSGSCPVSHWDWREHDPDVVGPFPSYEAADESYSQHEHNTGGHSISRFAEVRKSDETLAACIAAAVTPQKMYGWRA